MKQFIPYRPEKVLIKKVQEEQFPDNAVITLSPVEEGKRKRIEFNAKALKMLEFNTVIETNGEKATIRKRVGLDMMQLEAGESEKICYFLVPTDDSKVYKYKTALVNAGAAHSNQLYEALKDAFDNVEEKTLLTIEDVYVNGGNKYYMLGIFSPPEKDAQEVVEDAIDEQARLAADYYGRKEEEEMEAIESGDSEAPF